MITFKEFLDEAYRKTYKKKSSASKYSYKLRPGADLSPEEAKKLPKDSPEYFCYMVMNDARWTERGIKAICKKQTEYEQKIERTTNKNDIGFTKSDAPLMTSLNKQLEQGKPLSDKQLTAAKFRLQKYVGQLVKISKGEI